MLHEFEKVIEEHLYIYRNWSIELQEDLDTKFTILELKIILTICTIKYHDVYINSVAKANFKRYLPYLKEIREDKEFESLSRTIILEQKIPKPYTKLEIRNIKLGKVLDTEK